MDILSMYENLTNVNLDEQKRIWDERGKGYYGEYLVFVELLNKVEGCCKFLMNLNIPINGKATEIDLVMIHETGLYVFEVKHHKGDIYGKTADNIWTQYFRTTSNHSFKNPILQNLYHINALKGVLGNIRIFSVIAFTHEDVKLHITREDTEKIKSSQSIVERLDNLIFSLDANFSYYEPVFDVERIDAIFNELKQYSPMIESTISVDGDVVPFYNYVDVVREKVLKNHEEIEVLKNDYQNQKENLDKEYYEKHQKLEEIHKKKIKKLKNKKILMVVICFFVCGIFNSINGQKVREWEDKYNEYAKNFMRIEEMNSSTINNAKNIISVSDVNMSMSQDLVDTVRFSCTINNVGEDYGITLNADSTYLVFTTDGKIYEYDVFGVHKSYNSFSSRIGPESKSTLYATSIDLSCEFQGIKAVDDIEYIKIKSVSFWNKESTSKMLSEDLHIEIYSS